MWPAGKQPAVFLIASLLEIEYGVGCLLSNIRAPRKMMRPAELHVSRIIFRGALT